MIVVIYLCLQISFRYCIQIYYKADIFLIRYGYEAEAPCFDDVVRVDALDAEVAASGVTRQMEKDLQAEFSTRDESDDDDDVSSSGDDDSESIVEEEPENIEVLRKQLEESVRLVEEKLQSEGIQVKNPRLLEETGSEENEDENGAQDGEEDEDDLGNLRDFNSRFKPFRDGQPGQKDSDSVSVRSVSTTASTIGRSHPFLSWERNTMKCCIIFACTVD